MHDAEEVKTLPKRKLRLRVQTRNNRIAVSRYCKSTGIIQVVAKATITSVGVRVQTKRLHSLLISSQNEAAARNPCPARRLRWLGAQYVFARMGSRYVRPLRRWCTPRNVTAKNAHVNSILFHPVSISHLCTRDCGLLLCRNAPFYPRECLKRFDRGAVCDAEITGRRVRV